MDDGSALLAAIRANPDDDTPRLIYADWLDEQGDRPSSWMALFIRNSIKNGHDNAQGEFQRAIEHTDPFDAAKAFGLPEGWEVTCYRKLHELRSDGASPRSVLCVRGFPAEFACNLPTWQRLGPAIVRAHPVTAVRLVDKRAFGHTSGLFSIRSDRDPGVDRTWHEVLPIAFFDSPGLSATRTHEYFPSQDKAAEWISRRAIAWAKSPAEQLV